MIDVITIDLKILKPFDQQNNGVLSWIVAEYAGYKSKKYDWYEEWSGMYQLFAPNGDKVGDAEKHDSYVWEHAPQFAEDTKAALSLFDGLHSQITFLPDGGVNVLIEDSLTSFPKSEDGTDQIAELPRLISLAWLAWKDKQS